MNREIIKPGFLRRQHGTQPLRQLFHSIPNLRFFHSGGGDASSKQGGTVRAGAARETPRHSLRVGLGVTVAFLVMQVAAPLAPALNSWKAAEGLLKTRWAKEVSPGNALPEYPRPQMVRSRWLNLNGLWDCAVAARSAPRPQHYDGQILVPFPLEAPLSGVMKPLWSSPIRKRASCRLRSMPVLFPARSRSRL
jgi:hypothetical protein